MLIGAEYAPAIGLLRWVPEKILGNIHPPRDSLRDCVCVKFGHALNLQDCTGAAHGSDVLHKQAYDYPSSGCCPGTGDCTGMLLVKMQNASAAHGRKPYAALVD